LFASSSRERQGLGLEEQKRGKREKKLPLRCVWLAANVPGPACPLPLPAPLLRLTTGDAALATTHSAAAGKPVVYVVVVVLVVLVVVVPARKVVLHAMRAVEAVIVPVIKCTSKFRCRNTGALGHPSFSPSLFASLPLLLLKVCLPPLLTSLPP
jgi:hypothetical protein